MKRVLPIEIRTRFLFGFFTIMICFHSENAAASSNMPLRGTEMERMADKANPIKSVMEQTITGSVTDQENGQPLPGVSIVAKGTTTGTMTDFDGKYNFTVPDKVVTLEFSFVGYATQEVQINGRTSIDVVLVPSAQALDEVVVIGYGTQKKSDLTGSVSGVTSKELEKTPINRIDEALKGRAAGVFVKNNSNAPGGGISVQVRGSSSFTANGEPLYVIDGMPISNDFQTSGDTNTSSIGPPPNPLNAIDPSNIASIQVLKDASATAIYGSRGSNGVVIVTTKRGSSGRQKIVLKTSYSLQTVANQLELLDARQHAVLINENALLQDREPTYTGDEIAAFGKGTDWQDEIFRTAPTQNYQLSSSGGSDKVRYLISGNYLDQEGIIKGSSFKRYSANLNLDADVTDRLSVGSSLLLSFTENRISPTGGRGEGTSPAILQNIVTASPTIPARDANGDPTDFNNYPSGSGQDNPLVVSDDYERQANTDRIVGSAFGEYKLLEGLTAKVQIGTDLRNWKYNNYYPIGSVAAGGANGRAEQINSRTLNFLNENTLHYNTTINDLHNLDLLAGFTYQQQKDNMLSASSLDFPSDFFGYNNLGIGSSPEPPSSYASKWQLLSYIGRANYGFKDKYLITGTVRVDGSSKFGANNKYGVFPSVAVAWKLKEENFMQRLDAISNLKLRGSYGITGNNGIGLYKSLSILASDFDIKSGYYFNDQLVPIISPDNIANPDLSWEKTSETNVGLDLGLFNNRFNLTADYYYKKTTDLLLDLPVPLQTGFDNVLQNIGAIENKGLELSLESYNFTGKFKWNTNFNISFNRNKILSLGGLDYLNTGDLSGGTVYPFSRGAVRLIPGEPVGTFFGSEYAGIWQSQQEIDQIGTMPGAKPGDIRFTDTNGDGTFNSLDDRIIGDPNPNFNFGFTNDFSWKDLNLHIYMYGVSGNDVLNITKRTIENGTGLSVNRLNRWTPTNTEGTAVAAYSDYPQQINTDLIEDGSFLRVGTISLSYLLPVESFKDSAQQLRLTLAVDNPFTFTKYSGYDPEVNAYGGGTNSNIIKGIDRFAYPVARAFRIELQLTL